MGNVAIVTDSNSGISQAEGKELGIYVIPMPFLVDGKLYFEDVDMNKEQFYHFLENDADLSTSQPSPGDVMDLWDKLLKEYDEIVHIPMSSGLSASCSTAMGLARDYDGKVQVVDNKMFRIHYRLLHGNGDPLVIDYLYLPIIIPVSYTHLIIASTCWIARGITCPNDGFP